MTRLLARILPAVTLCAWSGLLLYFYFSGRIAPYLTPTFRWFALGAGLLLPVVAIGLLLSARGVIITPEEECEPATFGNAGGSSLRGGQWIAFLVLTVPIYAAATYTQDSYSAATIRNRGFVTDPASLPSSARDRLAAARSAQSAAGAPAALPGAPTAPTTAAPGHVPPPAPGALPPRVIPEPALPGQPDSATGGANGPIDIAAFLPRGTDGALVATVVDLISIAPMDSERPAWSGRKFEVVGQYLPDRNGSKLKFQLVRMFMYCCASDARPVALTVAAPGSMDGIAEMGWVKVIGEAKFAQGERGWDVEFQAERVLPIDPPADAMLY
ncbi:MAG: hypothetical protein JSR82_22785 [Verrucomicrobia bacterium]|nr:hypothetical protein [Verrucomicrobiota bacterium]